MLTVERFWHKVEMRGEQECWPWRTTADSYGRFNVQRGGRLIGAHVFSWILANRQDVPPGLLVLHSCDNKRCVNPNHLSLGTHAKNSQEAFKRGLLPHLPAARAARANRTTCQRGHELEGNHYVGEGGRRRCKTCHSMRAKKYRAKEKQMNNGNPNNHTLEWA